MTLTLNFSLMNGVSLTAVAASILVEVRGVLAADGTTVNGTQIKFDH